MAETLVLNNSSTKEELYKQILPQIDAVISSEPNIIANLANITSILKMTFNYFWIGFYISEKNELVLGPFQGDLACTRIPFGKGVCGKSALLKETFIVDDVNSFPGHIVCSALSKSEIVVPLVIKNECKLVIDIDSDSYSTFDNIDELYLKMVLNLIAKYHYN